MKWMETILFVLYELACLLGMIVSDDVILYSLLALLGLFVLVKFPTRKAVTRQTKMDQIIASLPKLPEKEVIIEHASYNEEADI